MNWLNSSIPTTTTRLVTSGLFLNGLVHDYHHYFPLKNHYVTVTRSSTFRNELATTNDKAGFLTVHGVFQTLKSFFLQNYLSKTDEQISSLELPVTMILTICNPSSLNFRVIFNPFKISGPSTKDTTRVFSSGLLITNFQTNVITII